MAATDQFYRNQRTLDVVFGVSSILMLVSLIVMFYQDQKKEWKDDQRLAYDVEEAMAQRALVDAMPSAATLAQAEAAVQTAQQALDEKAPEIKALEADLRKLLADKERTSARYQAKKADYDSFMSLIAIETEHKNAATDESRRAAYTAGLERMLRQRLELKEGSDGLDARLREFEDAERAYNDKKKELDALKKPVTEAVANLKKLNTEFDRLAKQTSQKQWKWYNQGFRNLPVIDGFHAPVRIHQFTLEELPIEYGSFKYVTRYDRCMSCHLAIDRPAYTREALAALKDAPEGLRQRLDDARATLQRRRELVKDEKDREQILDPRELGDLRTLPHLQGRHVTEFAAHPRLDLFVDDNSPHPKEKFGCTICHQGQGSATSFNLASHTPNDAATLKRWQDEFHWASNHYWDFPMLPSRFIESSCVKCHHQITDLIRHGSKEEAPKLLRGYNLVKDNGCFGCHEISGTKSGRVVGPDMRLEPSPPLDALTPAERYKALSDPLNPPGTMRKVGPSLRRLDEKTYPEWVRSWIKDPRGFRPDTKMPHFYGLSNNTPDVLPEGQKEFPDAEVHAVTHYLMQASRDYLAGKDSTRVAHEARQKSLQAKGQLNDQEKKELEDSTRYLKQLQPPTPLEDQRIELDGGTTVPLPAEDKDQAGQLARGRQLFTERGCLACHSHKGTETAAQNIAAVTGDAQFGPNLSRLAAKLGTKAGDKASARRWLVQWILNPNVYHPRTFMPITHLTVEQAADIAAWILSQDAGWKATEIAEPSLDTLKALARVWLEKSRTQVEIDDLLEGKEPDWLNHIRPDADEIYLKGGLTADGLKMYTGKKAVNNLGCYACHDIPGFENAKPIGTALNDWGKKDGERLAFEDIKAFLDKHYQPVADLDEFKGEGKPPIDKFYLDQIDHHTRIGFLQQKLREPRSFDYDRIRKWDERLRMPQFRFARVDRKPNEGDAEFARRAELAEAEAREAVMTFVLGLVAEPIPAKYVYSPKPDRLAEVKGRQVLDKFNCAGCHVVRAGVYEFKKTREVIDYLDGLAQASESAAKSEFTFHDHNAWRGWPAGSADRIMAHGTPLHTQPEEKSLYVRLSDALRYTDAQGKPRDVFAAMNLGLRAEDGGIRQADILYEGQPYGGVFANLMVPYLKQKDRSVYGDDAKALTALPPPLLRQGERTQPEWLYRFLRNPHAIRPVTVLRMPKFNMSDDEAMALVNYFAAADKIQNPAEGLVYPYAALPQRDDAYWARQTRAYVARLRQHGLYDQRVAEMKPLWEQQLKEEAAQFDKQVATAEALLKDAKDDAAKKLVQQQIDDLKKQRAANTLEVKRQEWEARYAYAADAYRALVNYNTPCMSCHRVGSATAAGEQGPPLEVVWDRLRPDWTEKWLANPRRMFGYDTTMPANFLKSDADPKGHGKVFSDFVGTPLQQATAVRDVLLNFPRVAELPVNRAHQPRPATGGGQ